MIKYISYAHFSLNNEQSKTHFIELTMTVVSGGVGVTGVVASVV